MDVRLAIYSLLMCGALLNEGNLVTGYPSGAPKGRCNNMLPGHGRNGSGAGPYSIDIGSREFYSPGETITATIRGGAFKGILLQVRQSDGSERGMYPPVGHFENFAVGTRGLNCSGESDALTQMSPASKEDIVVVWKAPNNDNLGDVHFVATVAQSKGTWWRNIKSSIIRPMSAKPKPSPPKSDKTTTKPTSGGQWNRSYGMLSTTAFLSITVLAFQL